MVKTFLKTFFIWKHGFRIFKEKSKTFFESIFQRGGNIFENIFFLKHIISDFFERKEQNILARKRQFFVKIIFFRGNFLKENPFFLKTLS